MKDRQPEGRKSQNRWVNLTREHNMRVKVIPIPNEYFIRYPLFKGLEIRDNAD